MSADPLQDPDRECSEPWIAEPFGHRLDRVLAVACESIAKFDPIRRLGIARFGQQRLQVAFTAVSLTINPTT